MGATLLSLRGVLLLLHGGHVVTHVRSPRQNPRQQLTVFTKRRIFELVRLYVLLQDCRCKKRLFFNVRFGS